MHASATAIIKVDVHRTPGSTTCKKSHQFLAHCDACCSASSSLVWSWICDGSTCASGLWCITSSSSAACAESPLPAYAYDIGTKYAVEKH